jgi:hypothetical protein
MDLKRIRLADNGGVRRASVDGQVSAEATLRRLEGSGALRKTTAGGRRIPGERVRRCW